MQLKQLKCPECAAGRAHQFLDLEALLVAQLAARHISCARVEANLTEGAVNERCVANGTPSAVVENFQAAKLSTAVRRNDAISQTNVPLFCTGLTNSVPKRAATLPPCFRCEHAVVTTQEELINTKCT